VVKLACVADVHLGNHRRFGGSLEVGMNKRCRAVLDGLEDALDLAVRERCAAFFIAGDLFDYVRPEAQLVAAAQGAFARAQSASGDKMRVVLLRGNHECVSAAAGDHALGPLRPVVEVVERPTSYGLGADGQSIAVGCVPYQPGSAMLWLPEAVGKAFGDSKPKGELRVLVMHLGIADDKTVPWLRNSHESVQVSFLEDLCKHHHIGVVLAGNWHDRRTWSLCGGRTSVLQVGALVPTGFDNPGLDGYGGVALVTVGESAGVDVREVIGPRFVKCTPGDTALLRAAQEYEGQVYVEMTAPADQLASSATLLDELVQAGAIADGVALPDAKEIQVAARAAASAARSSETLNEALAAFVADMPLEDGVDRDAVLERTRRYLGKAGG
jgi:hypothetical protein